MSPKGLSHSGLVHDPSFVTVANDLPSGISRLEGNRVAG